MRLDRLESELNSAKSNLIKESIRQGHNDLGDFYMERGDFQVRPPPRCNTPDSPLPEP